MTPGEAPPPAQIDEPAADGDRACSAQPREQAPVIPPCSRSSTSCCSPCSSWLLHHRDKRAMKRGRRGRGTRRAGLSVTMGQYLPILALLVLTALFGAISLVVSRLLNPPRPDAGQGRAVRVRHRRPGQPPERFPVRFYLIAMIFIVFDIEIIFLYPFTMVFRELGGFGLGAIVDLLGRGVRVVPLPDLQRRARLGSGQAAPPRRPWSSRTRTVAHDGAPGRPRGPAAASPTPIVDEPDDRRRPPDGHVETSRGRPRRPRAQLPDRQARGPREVGPRSAARGRPRSAWPAAPSR